MVRLTRFNPPAIWRLASSPIFPLKKLFRLGAIVPMGLRPVFQGKKLPRFPVAGFDFGTSPHGLSADLAGPHQETPEASSLSSLADKQAEGAQVVCQCNRRTGEQANGIDGAATAAPNAEAAAGVPDLLPYHYLELTDCEFLHLLSVVESSRDDMRKAIRKGKATEADMEGTATLWEKLQEVRALRLYGYLRTTQREAL